MEKVAIRLSADPSFFDEVAREAARLDRSQSWLLGWCLRAALPTLAASKQRPAAPTSASRRPTSRVVFVAKDLREDAERVGGELGMSDDDILAWAWHATRETVRALPSS
jgi:hypothetical protein